MKSKLKKKTKTNDVFFPHPQTFNFNTFHLQSKPISHKDKERPHRRLSRSYEAKDKTEKTLRSVSLTTKKTNNQKPLFTKVNSTLLASKKEVKSTSLMKKVKNTNSAADISSFFCKTMEKNLAKQCASIMQMSVPKRAQSTCQLQNLTSNMFLVRKNIEQRSNVKKNQLKVQQDPKEQTPSSLSSVVRLDSEINIQYEDENFLNMNHDIDLQSEYDLSEESLASIKQFQQALQKKKSASIDRRHMNSSQRSMMNTQNRYTRTWASSINNKTYMLSWKLFTKAIELFAITKLDIATSVHSEISLFFQISGQIVYKKISSNSEKRHTELKLRRQHTRKFQHFRQKSRQKIFNHFNKRGTSLQLQILYGDILSYIEHYMILNKSYRGLIFIDHDAANLSLSNQEKLLDLLNLSVSFYFILKLGLTFYLVKATTNELRGICFTFLCDFTNLSTGDQLVFPHVSQVVSPKLKKPKIKLMKASEEFRSIATKQWSHQHIYNNEISAKVGKITIQNLQKNSNMQGNWNYNKKFEMVGQTTNFFELHQHFDCGFFNRNINYYQADDLYYMLSRRRPLLFYKYPHSYQILEINQAQKEAIVIAHLPPLSQVLQVKTITSFYRREHLKKNKVKQNKFVMYLQKTRIYVCLHQSVDLFIESIISLRGHKLTLTSSQCLQNIKQINISSLRLSIQKALQSYRLSPSFLYKRYQKIDDPQVIMYYKAVHKFQGQFTFISLYKVSRTGCFQFKIYAFQLGKTFVVPLEVQEASQQQVKTTITNLISLFKNVFFKKVLQLEIRKSQQRRKEALQDFFKAHIKSHNNNIRMKRKNEEDIRKKHNIRLATLRTSAKQQPIYEEVISKFCQTYGGGRCYFTIRYLPTKEVKENRDINEYVELCLSMENNVSYFYLVIAVKELAAIVIIEIKENERSDQRYLLSVFKQTTNSVINMVKKTNQSFSFVITRLKHFFNPSKAQRQISLHPYVFRLIGNSLFQTKEEVTFSQKLSTKLSIDIDLAKSISMTSLPFASQREICPTELKLALPSFGKISGPLQRMINVRVLVDVNQEWLTEVVDIYHRSQDSKFGGNLTGKERQVRLLDRENDRCLVLGQWEGDFVNIIKFSQFNKRMFKRFLKAVRKSL